MISIVVFLLGVFVMGWQLFLDEGSRPWLFTLGLMLIIYSPSLKGLMPSPPKPQDKLEALKWKYARRDDPDWQQFEREVEPLLRRRN